MPGLKISELQQPSLTADRNVSLQDLIPIARTVGAALSTFSLPGAAFFTNLASVGVGSTLIGTKTFEVGSGNSYNIKSLSAIAPILLNDNGSTLTLAFSGSVLASLAGLTPIKTSFIAGSNPPAVGATFFNLPNVSLPTDANAYRVDINGVIQEPNVDYTIITNTTPFQIQFSTAPATGEKVVIVAFAPNINSLSANTILNANSVFANPTNVPFAATSVTLAQNQVLCNTNSNGLTGLSIGTNQFVGNTGSGLAAVTLSAAGGLSLNTSVANTATFDGSALLTMIRTLSSNMQNIGNYPYLEYAQVCAPNATRQSITGDSAPTTLNLGTRVLDQNNIATAFDSTTVTVPSGTYQYEATTILNSGSTFFTSILYLLGNSNIISRTQYGTQSNASGQSEFRNLLTGQITLSSSTILSIAATTSVNASVGPFDLPAVGTSINDQRTTLKLWKIA